ncbi:unnamed protein product [Rotaria sordida]|uniref:Pre-rRNA-processing protein TSR2 homolog n=1 Tax=Rotaria sordida TaxID=392033 RepID=A0A814YLX3_9BILA|nr:unnamed protein product [Rotaria sordida]
MSLFSTLLPIIRSVFSRWTALQISVSHSMGGPESQVKYEAFIEAFGQYLARNVRPSITISALEQDIQEYLDEILDEEFNTVLEDGSSNELAKLFIRYIQLIQEGKLVDVQEELQLQQSTTPAIQMSVRNENENDSSSSSEDDDDNERNNEIREEEEEESTNGTKSQAMDVDEEDIL